MTRRTSRGCRVTEKPETHASPLVGWEQRGEDVHGGRLARAVRPVDRALLDAQREVLHGLHILEVLGQALGLDDRGHQFPPERYEPSSVTSSSDTDTLP